MAVEQHCYNTCTLYTSPILFTVLIICMPYGTKFRLIEEKVGPDPVIETDTYNGPYS